MKVSLWILVLSVLAVVQGRDYCYGGRVCSTDGDCMQNDGGFGTAGFCCNSKCTDSYKFLPRGAACNLLDDCVGECSGDDLCVNGFCKGNGVTEGCDCTILGGECNSVTIGVGNTIPNTCQTDSLKCMMPLPRDAACSTNSTCASQGCYQGKCLGSYLPIGSTCRISQECGPYQCLNGKCAYKTEGMDCSSNYDCDYTKYWCKGYTFSTPGTCTLLGQAGTNCTSSSQCVSSTYCQYDSTQFKYTVCTQRVGEGAMCNSSIPCASGMYCMNYNYGVSKCVKYYSVADHQYCTTSIVCSTDATCAREGANTTAYFCVPDYSLAAGANCSSDYSCPEYGYCDRTTTPYTCTESMLNKACNYNSTTSDETQCGNLECGCNSKCEVATYNYRSCGGYNIAPGDPTKMNDQDRTSFANAYCCSLCLGTPDILSTTQTGFQVNCKSLSITAKPACNTTSGGEALLLNCDDWSAATLGSATNFSLLFALLASLVGYFY